jgi:hypothetical protein
VIGKIPHEEFIITVCEWNQKYLVKVETGPYEQTYKIPMTEVYSFDDLKKVFANELMVKIKNRFYEMDKDLTEAIDSL